MQQPHSSDRIDRLNRRATDVETRLDRIERALEESLIAAQRMLDRRIEQQPEPWREMWEALDEVESAAIRRLDSEPSGDPTDPRGPSDPGSATW